MFWFSLVLEFGMSLCVYKAQFVVDTSGIFNENATGIFQYFNISSHHKVPRETCQEVPSETCRDVASEECRDVPKQVTNNQRVDVKH